MRQRGRPPDNSGFKPEELLYYRFKPESVIGTRLLPQHFRCENMSVNWSRYAKPKDVIFDHPAQGIAQLRVGDLPADELPKNPPPGTDKKNRAAPHTFRPSHVPLEDNYSHSELWAYVSGIRSTKSKLPESVKKELRTILSDIARIVKMPRDG